MPELRLHVDAQLLYGTRVSAFNLVDGRDSAANTLSNFPL
jgi:hypothetical protein